MNYTINEFVDLYKSRNWDNAKRAIEIKKYVPLDYKVELLKSVVDHVTYKDGYMTKYDAVDSVVEFVMASIAAYTNLKVMLPASHEEYDLLIKDDLFKRIIEEVGRDFDEFSSIHELILCDAVKNNTLEDVINGALDKFIEVITPILQTTDLKIKELSESKILTELLKTYMTK